MNTEADKPLPPAIRLPVLVVFFGLVGYVVISILNSPTGLQSDAERKELERQRIWNKKMQQMDEAYKNMQLPNRPETQAPSPEPDYSSFLPEQPKSSKQSAIDQARQKLKESQERIEQYGR